VLVGVAIIEANRLNGAGFHYVSRGYEYTVSNMEACTNAHIFLCIDRLNECYAPSEPRELIASPESISVLT
jgi:hypothetical protein